MAKFGELRGAYMRMNWCAVGAMSLALAGCAETGPLPVYSQAGVASPPQGVTQYPNANPLANFQIAAQTAQSSPTTANYKNFMRSGFALIYIRCNEYFDQKGTDQANENLIRDSIAPLTAVITGILALHTYGDPANADHDISLLTLGGTTAVAGLDIYSKHFLFGADNIESVRQMTNEELNAHAQKALEMQPGSIEEAALQITDNQRICIPSHILSSTRSAIAAGKFAASVTGTGTAVNSTLLGQLGTALNLTPPIVTDTQAGLLFAASSGMVRSKPALMLVRAKLGDLPEDANPVSDDGNGNLALKSDFPFAQITGIFDAAPAATRQALLAQSKIILRSADDKAKSDQAAIRSAGGLTAFVNANGAPPSNLYDFVNSDMSDYSLPSPSTGELRRVRVKVQ